MSNKSKLMTETAPVKAIKLPKIVSTFVDPDGDVIEAGDDQDENIAAAYRKALEDDHNIQTDLEDDAIVAIVRGIPGDEQATDGGEDIRDARIEALRVASEPEDRRILEDLSKPVSAMSAPNAILANRYGSAIDAATDAIIDAVADSKEQMDGAPLVIADHLCTLWDGERAPNGYIIRVPAVDEMPIPGSNSKNKKGGGDNRALDRYKFTDRVDQKEKSGHFVAELIDSTPTGAKLRQDIADLQTLGQKDYDLNKVVNPVFRADEYTNNTAMVRDSTLDRLKARRASRIRAMSRAISFLQVINRVEDELPLVQWAYTLPDGGRRIEEVARLRKPIRFYTEGKDGSHPQPWSLSQVINLQLPGKDGKVRLNAIKQAGGTITALIASLRRKKAEPVPNAGTGTATDGGNLPRPNARVLDNFARMFNGEMEGSDKMQADAFNNELIRYLNVASPDRDETIEQLFAFVGNLNSVLGRYRKRYDAILDRQTQATNAQAKAS